METTDRSFSVRAGATRLVFDAATRDDIRYHFAFNIPRNKLALAKAWVADRVPLLERDGQNEFAFTNWNAHAFYFADPAGNIVEFIARHTLANDRPGGFSALDLLCVSEIGLAVEDVASSVAALTTSVGSVPYSAGSEDFAPLGDEHGLLIVVRVGRPWFPTALPAVLAPVDLVVEGTPQRRYQVPGHPYVIIVRAERSSSAGE